MYSTYLNFLFKTNIGSSFKSDFNDNSLKGVHKNAEIEFQQNSRRKVKNLFLDLISSYFNRHPPRSIFNTFRRSFTEYAGAFYYEINEFVNIFKQGETI